MKKRKINHIFTESFQKNDTDDVKKILSEIYEILDIDKSEILVLAAVTKTGEHKYISLVGDQRTFDELDGEIEINLDDHYEAENGSDPNYFISEPKYTYEDTLEGNIDKLINGTIHLYTIGKTIPT